MLTLLVFKVNSIVGDLWMPGIETWCAYGVHQFFKPDLLFLQ